MILRGFSGLEPAIVFELCSTVYSYKLVPPRFNSVHYRNFPTDRVCNQWNSLSKGIMNSPQSMHSKLNWRRSFQVYFYEVHLHSSSALHVAVATSGRYIFSNGSGATF